MIERIALKFGSSAGQMALAFDVTPVTVFVGPNYSGKSKIISEIASQCMSGQSMSEDVILESLTFECLNAQDADAKVENFVLAPLPGEVVLYGHTIVGQRGQRHQVHRSSLIDALQNPNRAPQRSTFARNYLNFQTLVLNGRNRIDLVNDQPGGDLQQPAHTSFQQLFRDDELRKRLSEVVYQAFGSYVVIDPTNLGQFRLRLSKSPPPSPAVERGLDRVSVQFHAAATHIAAASDGAKAFVGILAEILAGDPEILLIDEPEAFLHPALAFTLGREIARSLAASSKRMFVSTHSPQFLMGCIQSGTPINVVRLTYRDGVATARLLPSDELVKLMRNPLLRSTGVISALFYESVVVTEADPDRAFYQEINERLLRQGRGIPNCVFLNAQNKQTIPTIVGPLRRLGIPAAAIYDIDFVKDGGGVATRFMETAGIPQLAQQGLTTTRAAIATALTNANAIYKKAGGIEVLCQADKGAAVDYFDQLDAYGAFVVRGGELESWLRHLGIEKGHGPSWLISMFEHIGEDPNAADYVQPGDDDVWAFLDRVRAWLLNPSRKGIPV